jgi:UDP-perosamine 4-acetyltransferase
MSDKLIIFGAGGHASKIVQLAEELNIKVAGYISTEPVGTILHGYPVLGSLNDFMQNPKTFSIKVHIAIGEIWVRKRIFQSLRKLDVEILSIVAPQSWVSKNVTILPGTCIMQNAVIQPNCHVGHACIVDTGAIIEHDTYVGDLTNISPGAILCGGVSLGEGTIIGAGATIIEKTQIGRHSLIGAGSVVLQDIPENSVAVGVPAKVIRSRSAEDRYLKQ